MTPERDSRKHQDQVDPQSNGAHHPGTSDSTADVELTAYALDQVDADTAQQIRRRLEQQPDRQRIANETTRLAAAIKQSAEHQLPSGIAGLEQVIEQALDGRLPDGTPVDGDVQPAKESPDHGKPLHHSNSTRFRTLHKLVACAAMVLVGTTVVYLLLPRLEEFVESAYNASVFERQSSRSALTPGSADSQDSDEKSSPANIRSDPFLTAPTSMDGAEVSGETGRRFTQMGDTVASAVKDSAGERQQSGQYPSPQIVTNLNPNRPTMLGYDVKSKPSPAGPSSGKSVQLVDAGGGRDGTNGQVKLMFDSFGQQAGNSSGSEQIDNYAFVAPGMPTPRSKSIGESVWIEGRYESWHNKKRDDPSFHRGFFYGGYQTDNEQYELPPENRFQPVAGPPENALSTFSIDVDTASYSNLRRMITNRQLPPPAAIRIEELINYFQYDYPQPADGRPFSVNMEVAQCPWTPGHKLLRIGIKGQEMDRQERPPSNLVFLIDVSGSMANHNKLPLLQRSMLMLVDELTENDRVTIVTYAGNAGLRLPPTSGDQKTTIRDVIRGLQSGGSTHGSAGIKLAYDLATRNFISEGTNRVLLATDGDLNVGVTRDDELVRLIKDRAKSGVFLSVLGFGTGNLKDAKLEKLADNGNGNYSYIDSIREARKVLVEQMSGSLITIAKDVKIQVEFNPAEVQAYRLIGYENRALANREFDDDRVDAGEIGAGHCVTALYELVPAGATQAPVQAHPREMRYQQPVPTTTEVAKSELSDAASTGELVTLALRYKTPEGTESQLVEYHVQDNPQAFRDASVDFRFAASVASFGMLMRQSKYAGNSSLAAIEETAVTAIGKDVQGHRQEFVDLVRQAATLHNR